MIKLPEGVFHDIRASVDILNSDFSKNTFLRDDLTRCNFKIILLKIKEFFLAEPITRSNPISSTHPKIMIDLCFGIKNRSMKIKGLKKENGRFREVSSF